MQLRATSLSAGSSAIGAKQSFIAKMISTLRRLGGNLWMVDNAFSGAFVDNTGTTPVTAYGDLLGLTTDRLGVLGPNLFTGTYALGASTTATYSGGEATATFGGPLLASASNWLSIPGNTALGTFSVIEYWATYVSGGSLEVGSTWQVGDTITAASNGGVRRRYTTEVRTGYAGIGWGAASFGASAGSVWKVEVISVRELTGNHATQSAVASKPLVTRVPKRLGLEMIASQDLTTWTSGGAFGNWAGTTSTSTMITTTGVNGGRYVRLPCTPGKTYTVAALVAAGTGQGSVAIAYGTSGNALISEQTGMFTAAGVARVTTVAPANAAFVEFVIRGGTSGQTTTFTALTAGEVLEWANVISFADNDFLQTGITTGNEGWVCAGVAHNVAATAIVFSGGGENATQAGAALRMAGGPTGCQLMLSDGVTGQVTQSPVTTVAPGTPFVYEGGWDASTRLVGVNGAITSAAKTINCASSLQSRIGGSVTGDSPLNGPMHAIAYTPVLPDAATRKIIRNGIAALQGRTL